MPEARHPDGCITLDVQGEILLMGIDRREKYNGFTPKMLRELGEAYTRLDEDPALRVGVLHAHGPHFTAGLDLPRFVDGMKQGESARVRAEGERVDPVALGRACRVSAALGLVVHVVDSSGTRVFVRATETSLAARIPRAFALGARAVAS